MEISCNDENILVPVVWKSNKYFPMELRNHLTSAHSLLH